jgi:hypothetical protein
VNNESKIEMLEMIRNSIYKNIEANNKREKISIKYEWLAREFNCFLVEYLDDMMFLENENEPDADEIAKIKSLKIIEYV